MKRRDELIKMAILHVLDEGKRVSKNENRVWEFDYRANLDGFGITDEQADADRLDFVDAVHRRLWHLERVDAAKEGN